MAIDNAEKRKSLSGIQVTLMVGVTPNTAQDQEWRQEAGWGYPGIPISVAAAERQKWRLLQLTLKLGN